MRDCDAAGMRGRAGAGFVQVTWAQRGTRNGCYGSASPAWRSDALKVYDEDQGKSGVVMPVYEKACVNYVQMNAYRGLLSCVWSDQLRNSLRSDAHVSECESPQTEHAVVVAVGYCAAWPGWISSVPASREKSTVFLQTAEPASLVSLMMTASQGTLMTPPAWLN